MLVTGRARVPILEITARLGRLPFALDIRYEIFLPPESTCSDSIPIAGNVGYVVRN